MACTEKLSVQQRDTAPSERSQSNSDVDEATRLLGNESPLQRNGLPLLRRFKESVLIKSKAVNTIFFWNTLAYLLYGFLYNPDIVFVVAANPQFYSSDIFIPIGSGVYGLIAVWLLFYPLAGYLADVRYGRYRVVRCGLLTMWLALFTLLVVGLALAAVCWIPFSFTDSRLPWPFKVMFEVVFGVSSFLLGVLFYITFSVGFAVFSANVIQFGINQLRDSPTRDSFLFIHWFVLTMYIGLSVGKLTWSVMLLYNNTLLLISIGVFGLAFLIFLIALPVSLCITKQSLFIHDTGLGNPYKEVARIVGFARKHNIPIQRSAFTFWEDDIPTGLNLGKSKYGGPFTTEQVENVKAFFGILLVLISLGPFFTADIAGSAILPLLKPHFSGYSNTIANALFANGGTCYPLFIVLFIPIFLKFLYPLFQRYATSILGRIGIGLCLTTVSLVCSLSMDKIGHATANVTSSLFAAGIFEDPYAHPLNFNPYILILQNILIAISYTLIYGGVFEFICAQSPHSMKGFLIGIFFAVKGLFQLIGVFAILLPFSFWTDSPQVGLAYYLLNIVISISGVVFFILAARRYQYRQREEFYNERKYIEEFYEKDVRHNQDFEDLHFEFDSNVDSD